MKRGVLLNLDPLPKEGGQQKENETTQNEKKNSERPAETAVYNIANFDFSQEILLNNSSSIGFVIL